MPRRAVELGVDNIGTSDFHGPWVVKELIAEALWLDNLRSRELERLGLVCLRSTADLPVISLEDQPGAPAESRSGG